MGIGHVTGPVLEDVLECLRSDCSMADLPFEKWADAHGYDSDSRKAYRTWELVSAQEMRLKQFFGKQYNTFLNLDQDA
jgi:hypothetical protein